MTPEDLQPQNPSYDLNEINYHMDLVHEAGFINDGGGSQPMFGFIYCGLSWRGHEFLDDVRDPDVWLKTKERAKGMASVGIGFIWEIAKLEVKARPGLS